MCGRAPLIGSVAPGSLHLAGHLSELGGVRPPADVMGLVLCEGGGSLSLPPTAPRVLPIPFPHVRRLLLSPPGWARGPVLAISPFTGCCPKTHLESPLFPERWSHPQPTTESLSLASCLLTHKCVCVCGGRLQPLLPSPCLHSSRHLQPWPQVEPGHSGMCCIVADCPEQPPGPLCFFTCPPPPCAPACCLCQLTVSAPVFDSSVYIDPPTSPPLPVS